MPRTITPAAHIVRLALLIAMAGGALGLWRASVVAAEPDPGCSVPLQTLIDAAPDDATLTLPPCVYRETVTIRRPLTLVGVPGTEIRGSDVWANWTPSGGVWIGDPLPVFTQPSGEGRCRTGTSRCHWPEQVFFDGQPLVQVAPGTPPGTGQFALNANREIVLADDPAAHTVEVTTRQHWVEVQSNNVTLQGLTMKHASPGYQDSALTVRDGLSNITIQDNILSDSHASVVRATQGGTGNRLLRNDISRGGNSGVSGGGGLIQANRIHHNNTQAFDENWSAAGLKAGKTVDGVWEDNDVYENDAVGLWCDVDCRHMTIANNRIHDNSTYGILFEISDGVVISGNAVWENGYASPYYGGGAGIVISSSANADVHDNTLAWNAAGVHVILADRHDYPFNPIPSGTHIGHNTIIMGGDRYGLAWLGGSAAALARDAGGSDNSYWYPSAENGHRRFHWQAPLTSLSAFSATRGDVGGQYLSLSDKEHALSSRGMPLQPRPR